MIPELSSGFRSIVAFPLPQKDLQAYIEKVNSYYHFKVASHHSTLGFVLPFVAEVFARYPGWELNSNSTPRTLTLNAGNTELSRSALVASTLADICAQKHFAVISKWRNELKPAYGPTGEVLFSMERAAVTLLGIVSYGIHMIAYTRCAETDEPKLWISKRSKTVAVYPGLLDNCSLVREAHEEASLPADLVRANAKACGTLSYLHSRNARAGGEIGLLQPDVHFLFECELPADVEPKPFDDEVEWYQLWDIEQIKEGLRMAKFKPSFALVMLDFFVRHGVLNEGNEKDFVEICARLHRTLEFSVGGVTFAQRDSEAKI
ncbi:uncharacterized protein LY89DRAFT_710554 [Mollisia scopiformis]|uniref:Nudix hydrolase domain-containing protein n=1 Tax=Mollisia scopiformis TaxID=149040 RepID=A0A194WT75_MOLSC|nr:uncharacterized protein LY89DRAFT_710554 [Mollisia scopiformis]KUJ10822.1 hypothetical protein LY89DRAFT_710554 [Mollisia scopiformis]